jgi:hypothetical protein
MILMIPNDPSSSFPGVACMTEKEDVKEEWVDVAEDTKTRPAQGCRSGRDEDGDWGWRLEMATETERGGLCGGSNSDQERAKEGHIQAGARTAPPIWTSLYLSIRM